MTRQRKIRRQDVDKQGKNGVGPSESRPVQSEEIIRQNRLRIQVAQRLLSDSDRLLTERSANDD